MGVVMESENGIQEKRPGIENVLKAMNREGRLKEARADRQEVLAKRQSDQVIPGTVIARTSSNDPSRGSGKVPANEPDTVVTFPIIKKQSEPLLLRANETALDQAGVSPETPSIARSRPRMGVVGLIAFGFGVGFGIGMSAYLIMTMFGNRIDQPVPVAAPDLFDAPIKTKPEIAVVDGDGVASLPDVQISSQLNPLRLAAPEAREEVPALPPNDSSSLSFVEADPAWFSGNGGSNRAPDTAPSAKFGRDRFQDPSLETAATSGSAVLLSPDSLVRLPSDAFASTQLEAVSRPFPKEEVSALERPRQTLATGNTYPEMTGRLQPSATSAPGDLHIPGAEGYKVRLYAPSKTSGEEVDHVAETVRGTGMSLPPIQRVGFNVSATHVRYFHDNEAAAAQELAERLGAQARDFTDFRPSPQNGSIEIYVAGNGVSAAPSSSGRARQTPALERFLNRLFNGSRRGDRN